MNRQLKENKDNNAKLSLRTPKNSIKPKANTPSVISNQSGAFHQSQQPLISSKEGHTKLLELTSQCMNYFNRFVLEKDIHFNIIHKAFKDLKDKVQEAFAKIIQQAHKKSQQICSFLLKQQDRLLQQKKNQEQTLRNLLHQIQEVHLARLLGPGSSSEEFLTEYARTLQSFFNVMMQVEKSGFEDNLQQCVNFINNLVKQQLKMIVEQKFPRKISDLIITHNHEQNYFTFDQGIPNTQEPPDSFLDNINPQTNSDVASQIRVIREKQATRAKNLQTYEQNLGCRNPFKGIRLND